MGGYRVRRVRYQYGLLTNKGFPPSSTRVLASIADDMTGFDGDDRLRFGIDALIAGLEAVDRRG